MTTTEKKMPRWVRRNCIRFRGAVLIVEGKPMILQRNRVVDIVDRLNRWTDLAAFGVQLNYSLFGQDIKPAKLPKLIDDMLINPGARIHVEAKFIA